ncbi:MbcA/ParS/Xre antitoxin family protein [Pseudophaeobacter sp. EL27]|uniref:MbcA/ParS/Xre antitoxin family protein n=1 Tax=Pseudophaeobacter sp. EL27 TaxID=2107580 RepID=UPI000EFB5569|nr:MbcA/ParS/Xre antitoxin family protein [Pseudophaeobacter sp. EL27]
MINKPTGGTSLTNYERDGPGLTDLSARLVQKYVLDCQKFSAFCTDTATRPVWERILNEVTNDEELAAEFAMRPQPYFDGQSIVSHCTTQEGIKAVEGFLTQIDYGVYV